MDHTTHTPLRRDEFTDAILDGAPVYGANDEKVGTISHIHSSGIVVDVGGFLGIGAKPILVDFNQVDLMRDEDGTVHGVTSWTKDQLRNLPEHHH